MNNLLSLKKNLLIAALLDLTLLLLVLKLLMKVSLARTMLGSFLGLYILNGEQTVTAFEESKDLSSLVLGRAYRQSKKSKGPHWRFRSDSENNAEDKTNNETCLMSQPLNEVNLNSSYYSDNASSIDNDSMQLEYDNLCEISLKIIKKNKVLKTKRDLLEKEILELNEKIKKLERNKEIDITCKSCQELKLGNARLKKTQVKFVKFHKSANSLKEMLNNQKSSSCKIGLGFDSSKASTSGTKLINFVGSYAKLSPLVDDDVGEDEVIENNTKVVNNSNEKDESIEVDEVVNIKESKNHLLEQVIEPKNANEALRDESLVIAMQEELNQFVANDVWDLVPLPISQTVIGTKCVFRNKLDKNGIVSRNKARLVA
ncbi:zf-CCHC domain-containing protein [Tanacetum coccineum]